MQEEGGRVGEGECAGSVQDNPIASSLIQNKSDAKAIDIIILLRKNCNTTRNDQPPIKSL